MFTGLAAGRGRILAKTKVAGGQALTIKPLFSWDNPLALGESVAVSGVCLTVEKTQDETFTAFASQETLTRSTLSAAREVNLERALKLSDRLGGHIVSGHVDDRGRVLAIAPSGLSREIRFFLPPKLAPLVVEKGSIAVEGISLTVNLVGADYFTVQIIPATLERTTLVDLTPGQEVNLETDILARYVQKLLSGDKPPGLTLEKLAENGFL